MLYAISDIHLSYPGNRDEWQKLKPHLDDGLILCGDVGEKAEHLDLAFSVAKSNFKEVWWCPGNHELYSMPLKTAARGEDKYNECVEIARRHGVHTPEDPFVQWDEVIVAPIFTLYDYSFRPLHLTSTAAAIAWAEETDTVAADEALLFPDPHPSREAWCTSLVASTAAKLESTIAASPDIPLILVNHWPLRQDLVYIPRIPRFSIWCGTTLTEDWHTRFNAAVVISGHLHVPRTDWRDGVRFEEVSLGYPREWNEVKDAGKDVNDLLRIIWPGPERPQEPVATQWRRWG
ncbi:Metallo-dependent phosphatase-like protein [Roridomyces roridus]|uniref:Metallo-dependent phosphatase-like protein n=1 Tax=Roridomyces roridus TaxID=1738132 RepID=A0AAD7AY06_9AGAR|nr:Metallo-dependent phosphatase-like protein [Roridomyces roridus]